MSNRSKDETDIGPCLRRGDEVGGAEASATRRQFMGRLCVPRRGRVLHPRLAWPVEPDHQPARQSLRHDRHANRGGDDAGDACADLGP